MIQTCNTCDIEKDKDNYLKDRNVCKSCYNKNRRKINNNTLIQSEQPKSDNDKKNRKFVNCVNKTKNNKKKRKFFESVNNRTLIIGFLNCGKTYLMNLIVHQRQEPIFLFTKSLNQYPNIEAQTSDENEPLENYENSTVVFDDMLLSKEESIIDLFFTRGRHQNIDLNYLSQSFFQLPKHYS